MASTENQKKASAKYDAKIYERISLLFRKDSKVNADFIRGYAESRNESVNGFLLRAVSEAIQRDNKKGGI